MIQERQDSFKSSLQYVKVFVRNELVETKIRKIEIYKGSTLVDTSSAEVICSRNPKTGNLNNFKNGELLTFEVNELVELTMKLPQIERDITKVSVFCEQGVIQNLLLVQLSKNGQDWYTVYDSNRESNTAEQTNGIQISTEFQFKYDWLSKIIMDTDARTPFNPKELIWDNDRKIKEYVDKYFYPSINYVMDPSSTSNTIELRSENLIYPESYEDNLMVHWIQLGQVRGVTDIRIQLGSLGYKKAHFNGLEVVDLDQGSPYIAVYNKKLDKFLILSGGGSGGSRTSITLFQPNSGFHDGDLASYDPTNHQWVVPDLKMVNPRVVDAILKIKGNWVEGILEGVVDVKNLVDSKGNPLKYGEIYAVDVDNPTKMSPDYPKSGYLQPIMKVYKTDTDNMVGLIYDGPIMTHDYSLSGIQMDKTLSFRDNILSVNKIDSIQPNRPDPENRLVTEKAMMDYIAMKPKLPLKVEGGFISIDQNSIKSPLKMDEGSILLDSSKIKSPLYLKNGTLEIDENSLSNSGVIMISNPYHKDKFDIPMCHVYYTKTSDKIALHIHFIINTSDKDTGSYLMANEFFEFNFNFSGAVSGFINYSMGFDWSGKATFDKELLSVQGYKEPLMYSDVRPDSKGDVISLIVVNIYYQGTKA